MTARLYRFKIENKIPFKQKLLAYFVGGILSAGLIYYFIISIDSASLWLPILIFIVGLLVIFYVVARLLVDKKPLSEEITFTKNSITSKVYGKIDFKNIKYILKDKSVNEFYSLQIFLKDGSKHTWRSSNHKEISIENEQEFNLFCQEFSKAFQEFKNHRKFDFPQRYKFIFYKEINYLYGLICFVFVPILLLMDDVNDLGLWSFPVIFIPIIGGLILMFKKVIQKEEIVLHQNYMISKKHGKIDFKTIKEIISSTEEHRPTLTLKLRNKNSISWKTPSFGALKTEQETKLAYAEIRHFILNFSELINQYSKTTTSSAKNYSTQKTISEPTFSSPQKTKNRKQKSAASCFSDDFSTEKKPESTSHSIPHIRKKKNIYIGVPAGIAIALLILSRNCAGDFQKKKNPFYQFDQKTEKVQQQAFSLLNDFTKKNGPYYIYTHQDSVEIYYYPTKKIHQKKDRTESLLEQAKAKHTPEFLQKSNQTMDFYYEMQYAKQYPDSVNWQMILQNPKAEILLQKSLANQADSTDVYLYLAYVIPNAKIERTPAMQAYAKRKGLPETEDQTGAFAIPLYENSSVKDYLQSENFPLQHFLYLRKHYADKMQIYMVMKEQKNTSAKDFEEFSIEILNTLEVDKMKIKEFNLKTLAD